MNYKRFTVPGECFCQIVQKKSFSGSRFACQMEEGTKESRISGKAKENMETVKRSSNNVIEFLQSDGYIRFKADREASSKAIY